MRCMYCNNDESKVVDSRPTEEGWAIRRRRECINCSKRFTTYEKIENPMILVVKSDGERQTFDPSKIRSGLIKACEKRPVSAQTIDKIVSDVEKMVYNSLDQEITSHDIGEKVMNELRELDQVAYVRFASVYRHFRDINSFRDELNELLKD
ncbi:MAG: transcriptional repressor NrdR [Clostridiales bacterium]|nr:transcriptional repressor NrdR [Clostridiales bacterium]